MTSETISKLLFKKQDYFEDFQKLLQFGFMNGVQSIALSPNWIKDEVAGTYDNVTKSIIILIPLNTNKLNEKHLITSLAHEIGHHMSLNFANDYEYLYHYFQTNEKTASDNYRISEFEKSLLLEEELFAWENALDVLKELNILSKVEKDLHEDFHYSYEQYMNIPLKSK